MRDADAFSSPVGGTPRVESKIDGGLDRVESKIDGVVTNISERKVDTNERWEIGGIFISIFLAVSAFVKSFFL